MKSQDEFESCWFDACEDEKKAQVAVCQWLEVFEKKCDDENVAVEEWRRPDFCRKCGVFMEESKNIK